MKHVGASCKLRGHVIIAGHNEARSYVDITFMLCYTLNLILVTNMFYAVLNLLCYAVK